MPTAMKSSLDDQVDKAVMTLRRRHAAKEVSLIAMVLGAVALLLVLTAVMHQAPLQSVTPNAQFTDLGR